jgi:hypothetical protein
MPSAIRRAVYRTTPQRRLFIGALVVYVLVWLGAIGEVAATDGISWTRRGVGIALIGAHLAVVVWFVACRVATAGVYVGRDDLVIRNPLKSQRIECGRVDHFSVEPEGAWTMGYVHTRDGSSVRIFGIQSQMPSLFPKSRWAEEPIEQLNRLLADRQAGVRGRTVSDAPASSVSDRDG